MINNSENMKTDYQSALRFVQYIVNTVEFHTNEEFDEETSVGIDFSVKREIKFLDDKDNIMLVTLLINIFDSPQENNYPFSMFVSLTGIFEIDDVSSEQKNNLAQVNAVAILFPYVRSLVSTYTANANVSPLILPAINVIKLIESQED